MNEKKKKTFLEIVYNCPFFLLLLLTGLLAAPFLDENGMQKSDDIKAVFQIMREGEKESAEKGNGPLLFLKTLINGENSEEKESVDPAREAAEASEKMENAGARREDVSAIEDEKRQNSDSVNLKNAEKPEKKKISLTRFVEYEPIETNSRYYTDAGKVALTTDYDYVLENDSYFNDAVFLGDSRTLGISDYAGFTGADFFCDNGMTIYKLLEDAGVTWQKTGEKADLKQILQNKRYGKIYIMLGMNELGYGDTPMYQKQYRQVIDQIKAWQPDAVIYVMGNLHVSRKKNNMESEFNNININDKNVAAASLANGRDVFYLDCNPLFTDAEGFLQEELTFDGVHLYAKHYDKWRTFLLAHGVEREGTQAASGGQPGERAGESQTALPKDVEADGAAAKDGDAPGQADS